jgi:hypothetical protein
LPKITVYTDGEKAKIDQMPMQRDWMDLTFDRHAYQCFPVSLSNRLGWGISFPEDIAFIWDGVNDSTADHVKVLSGEKYAYSGRGNRTISFNTDLTFVSDSPGPWSILTMPPPNIFIRGAQCMTTLISPTALEGQLPIAWMITEPNVEITIPANTPIASLLPISLLDIQNYPITVKSGRPDYENEKWLKRMRERGDRSQELNMAGTWTHFYRDAVDHNGEKMGEHEVKKIIMEVKHEF